MIILLLLCYLLGVDQLEGPLSDNTVLSCYLLGVDQSEAPLSDNTVLSYLLGVDWYKGWYHQDLLSRHLGAMEVAGGSRRCCQSIVGC